MVASVWFGTVTRQGTFGRQLFRRPETESLRQAPWGPRDLNPNLNISFSVDAHCVLLPVKQEEGRPASARLTSFKCWALCLGMWASWVLWYLVRRHRLPLSSWMAIHMIPPSPEDNIQLEVGDTDGKEDCQYKENHLGDFGGWQDLMRKGKWGWRRKMLL